MDCSLPGFSIHAFAYLSLPNPSLCVACQAGLMHEEATQPQGSVGPVATVSQTPAHPLGPQSLVWLHGAF